VRIAAFDRAQFSDHFDGRHAALTIFRSIASSRKRKLRELFAVATDEHDGIPDLDSSDPDAPPTRPAESKFLAEFDICQYVPLCLEYHVLLFPCDYLIIAAYIVALI
jgi:hypothetical protein